MDTLSRIYSNNSEAVQGGRVYSVIVRPNDDSSYLAICKLDGGARGYLVCYARGDNPDTALARLADTVENGTRWRTDRLETRL